MDSFAADQHFQEQEKEYHATRRVRRLLRDGTIREVLEIMTAKGSAQAAAILAERG